MKRLSIFIALIAFMLNANAQYSKPNGYINGYPYVEMCGMKWAYYNVGASSPTGYGNYYAWGETQPAADNDYSEENCRLYGKDVSDIGGDPRYDAARAIWGSTWRLPTIGELRRLMEQCEWDYTTISGVIGLLVTDSSTGKSIFLPFAGYRCGSDRNEVGSYGIFWSSTPLSGARNAYYLNVNSGGSHYWGGDDRYLGFSVRPVAD